MSALSNLTTTEQIENEVEGKTQFSNFSSLLDSYNITYRLEDPYLIAGEVKQNIGWMLDLSIVIYQVETLLQVLLPTFKQLGISFKIPKDLIVCKSILEGHLGYNQVGRIVTLYPDTYKQTEDLALSIISITKQFFGPKIPADHWLAGIVYTRFGAFNPKSRINQSGFIEQFVPLSNGSVYIDKLEVPFQLPKGVKWPFAKFPYKAQRLDKNILNGKYKPVSSLKGDARGNVWKALQLISLFKVKDCVIKQGRQYSCSDQAGRDISDRLKWQKYVHEEMLGHIPVPKILDYLEVEGDTYLVMEYIKGPTLNELVKEINKHSRSWWDLHPKEKTYILELMLKVLEVVDALHRLDYVHRDITPENFILHSQGSLYVIDLELCYSLKLTCPSPPYGYGTPGFMAPEQANLETPTFGEDIYGLSATILSMFSPISPAKITACDPNALIERLQLFIPNKVMVTTIAKGLRPETWTRPSIADLKKGVTSYLGTIENSEAENINTHPLPGVPEIRKIINRCLQSLTEAPLSIAPGLWVSRLREKEPQISTPQHKYSLYVDLLDGLSGVLRVITIAHRFGYETNFLKESFNNAWGFIYNRFLVLAPAVPQGYYFGAAGICSTISACIKAGLLEDKTETRAIITKCLGIASEGISLGKGLAGVGIALLNAKEILTDNYLSTAHEGIIENILGAQTKLGYWQHLAPLTSFGNGPSGVVWFLLEYYAHRPTPKIKKSVQSALSSIESKTEGFQSLFAHSVGQVNETNLVPLAQDMISTVSVLLKGYEILREECYKSTAEAILNTIPFYVASNTLSQSGGLAELGDLYLEAYRVFENEEWKNRAAWIACLFINTLNDVSGCSCYWHTQENEPPTADFLNGTIGVLHFLIKYQNPTANFFRLLN